MQGEARQSESNVVGRFHPPPKQSGAKSSSFCETKKTQNLERKLQLQREMVKQKRLFQNDSMNCRGMDSNPKGNETRQSAKNVKEPKKRHDEAKLIRATEEASNKSLSNLKAIYLGEETNRAETLVPLKSLETLISELVGTYNRFIGKSFSLNTSSSSVDVFDKDASPENILKLIPPILQIKLCTKCDQTSQNFNKSNAKTDLDIKKETISNAEESAAVHIKESERADPESDFSSMLKSVQSVKSMVQNRHSASKVATRVDPSKETGESDVRKNTSTTMTNEEMIVREIQWQIWIRMIAWDASGKEGLACLDRLLVLKAEDDLDENEERLNLDRGKVITFIFLN